VAAAAAAPQRPRSEVALEEASKLAAQADHQENAKNYLASADLNKQASAFYLEALGCLK